MAKIEKYRWKYFSDGSVVLCQDNNSIVTQAMCASYEVAETFVKILNAARKKDQCL